MQNFGIPICPITQEAIVEPYIDREGNSYEKNAILAWISINNVSPITRNPLNINDLQPNRDLKYLIENINLNVVNQQHIKNEHNAKFDNCSKCNKIIKVSNKYRGKNKPICYNCRPWSCSLCTYSNNSNRLTCEMCENSK